MSTGKLHKDMKACPKCRLQKEFTEFYSYKRKDSIAYRKHCKQCEIKKTSKHRSKAKKQETDPAFFINDEFAKMPSDSDLLYWSTPYFDELVDGRKKLNNRAPDDEK